MLWSLQIKNACLPQQHSAAHIEKLRGSNQAVFELQLCDLDHTGGQPIVSEEIRICESELKHDPLIPSPVFKLDLDLNAPPLHSVCLETWKSFSKAVIWRV